MRVRLALVALVLCSVPAFAQERFAGSVVAVSDGDTIAVMREGRAARVRLEGIDCPERGQDFGQRAKQFTSDMAFGKDAVVEVRDVDRYGRLVARVTVDGEDVSLALVRSGLAWHYTKYSRDPKLAEAEKAAKSAKVGLWSRSDPIPPWEFRQPAPLRRDPVASRLIPWTSSGRSPGSSAAGSSSAGGRASAG